MLVPRDREPDRYSAYANATRPLCCPHAEFRVRLADRRETVSVRSFLSRSAFQRSDYWNEPRSPRCTSHLFVAGSVQSAGSLRFFPLAFGFRQHSRPIQLSLSLFLSVSLSFELSAGELPYSPPRRCSRLMVLAIRRRFSGSERRHSHVEDERTYKAKQLAGSDEIISLTVARTRKSRLG